MDGLRSPDLPAACCYFVVLVVGMLAARAAVNKLLDSAYGRWSFTDTWVLFYVQSALPVALFWFLDYTGVIRDTSLFAALIVSAGYQQIFAGGVKNIALPGETAKLWQPFETWRNIVANRIARAAKRRLDRFDHQVARFASSDPLRLNALLSVVLNRSADPTALSARLQAIRAAPADFSPLTAGIDVHALLVARILVLELRASEPELYGRILQQAGLVSTGRLKLQLTPARRAFAGTATGILSLAVPIVALANLTNRDITWHHAYIQWRLTKPDVSTRDRFRTIEHLLGHFHPADVNVVRQEIGRAIDELRHGDLPPAVVDAFARLAERSPPKVIKEFWIPELIGGLQTPSAQNRAKLHACLIDIATRAYPKHPPALALPADINPANESHEAARKLYLSWSDWLAATARDTHEKAE